MLAYCLNQCEFIETVDKQVSLENKVILTYCSLSGSFIPTLINSGEHLCLHGESPEEDRVFVELFKMKNPSFLKLLE